MPRLTEKTKLCCCVAWFIVILCVAVVLAVSLVLFPYAVEYEVEQNDAIVPGSELTQDWITPPVPLYATFTFFTVNNKDEVVKKGKKANLSQVGPFYYKYYRNKFNVTWDDDQSRVSYHLDTYYVFDREKSFGDPRNYTITTLNAPLLGFLLQMETLIEKVLKKFGPDVQKLFLDAIEDVLRVDGDHKLFYDINVYDLLWGYHDPVLQLLKDFRLIDNAMFSLEQNHSTNDTQGWSTVKTGKYNPKTVGEFTQWNNLREIALWNSSDARRLRGTDGYLFHANVKRDDKLRAFVTELYRSGDFVYTYDTSVYGIKLYHFVVAPYEFANASTYTPNYGYSAYGKPGVLNLTAVFPANLPVFVCKPHFLDADTSYLEGVDGLPHPDRSKDDAFLEVEPLTGAVLHGAKRLQFNVLLKKDEKITQLKYIRGSTMFPWFIATEESTITESKANDLKAELLTPIKDTRISLIVGTAVFGALSLVMLVSMVLVCIRYRRYRRQQAAEGQQGSVNSRTPLLAATLLNQSENSS